MSAEPDPADPAAPDAPARSFLDKLKGMMTLKNAGILLFLIVLLVLALKYGPRMLAKGKKGADL